MKSVNLDHEPKRVKDFVRSLPVDADGSILELEGKPVLCVFPIETGRVDQRKLKAAILKRREASRKLNQDWKHADLDVWKSEG